MIVSMPWISQLLLITIRFSTVLLLTPIHAIRQLPVPIRLLFVFILSFLCTATLPHSLQTNNGALFLGGVAECANGLILASSLYAAFAVFQIAGQLIDNQTGFNMLAVFKPDEHAQDSFSGHLLSMLSVLFFFGIDGHLWLFKSMYYSFVLIPPGTFALLHGFSPIVKQCAWMFSMSFIIASPIVIALLSIDVCSAFITRTMPQINAYFITLPLKIMLGLLLLAMTIQYINPIMQLVFEHCFHTWQELLS